MPSYTWFLSPVPTEKPTTYKVPKLVTEGETPEAAYEKALPQVPEGSKIWTWWENAPSAVEVQERGEPMADAKGNP